MTNSTDTVVTVTVGWWYAGTIATVAAILNDADIECGKGEQEELEKFLNRLLDVCHPAYYIDVALLLERYVRMFRESDDGRHTPTEAAA